LERRVGEEGWRGGLERDGYLHEIELVQEGIWHLQRRVHDEYSAECTASA
jgi:hypothetical protein